MTDLRQFPYSLKNSDILWVENTLQGMSTEEKIGQLFCLTPAPGDDETKLRETIQTFCPGAVMHRSGPAESIYAANQVLNETSRIPLLLAANLESGGNGIASEGTHFAKQMAVAATGETQMARNLGYISAKEGAATGCNWAFAPIVDIDMNWRNPIANVRTYGSNVETVLEMSRAWLRGARESGAPITACIKHFPGDGVDERDQHLTPTVNSLTADEWRKTYGRIYRGLIDEGVLSIMVGHILQPALVREKCPGIADKDILPASTNAILIKNILRDELGFQGLVITDATPMVGFSAMNSRAEALRLAIQGGADMILFTKNTSEDYESIRQGVQDGSISESRLNDAVRHILGVKAAMGLHEKKENGTLQPPKSSLNCIGCPEHAALAYDCADKAITLVKDTQSLLPLSPEKTPRIRLTILGEQSMGSMGDNGTIGVQLKEALEKNGFEVHVFDDATLERGEIFCSGVEELKEKFDLSLVAANVAAASNHTTRRLDWITLMAANEPWYIKDIPTLMVSFANPYHLVDAPFISTYINCYTNNEASVEALVEKLMGRSPFKGVSPVDPFCNVFAAETL